MRAHIIENGIVVNTILVDNLDFMPNLIDGSIGAIGWQYIDGKLIEPTNTDTQQNIYVPSQVEGWIAREVLGIAGLSDDIQAVLAAIDPIFTTRYNSFTKFERDNELILSLGAQIGLTDAQIDSLFIVCSKITSGTTTAQIQALLVEEGFVI